ncbi:MAG TPA: BatA domain-containing protein [Gemmatimonadales bacterium]
MEFLQPVALFGLAAAALPALLHLLQRRQPPTVVFPAVRYLVDAEERHSRRLRIRNLLLLLLRTALIMAIALAAARPVVPTSLGRAHAPSALVVVLDHSLSSGAVVDGAPRIAGLRRAARAIGREAGAGDRLWLMGADGTPHQLTPGEWAAAVDALDPVPRRLDLGAAVRAAAAVVRSQRLPGAVVVLSDLQATAVTDADTADVPVILLDPGAPPGNRGIGAVDIEPETWTSGGTVVVTVVGDDTSAVEVRLERGAGTLARGLAGAGGGVALAVADVGRGWHVARVALTPDELRADDAVAVALHGSPPAAVTPLGAGPFVEAGIAVLAETGRVRAGRTVVLGDRPEAGRTILLPPADPARIGVVNRALAARGAPVRFGARESGEWALESDLFSLGGAAVRRRYRLEGDAAVLATAGDAPWIVRAGPVVVVGSRFEEDWTDLPLRPEFVPFLDALVNRVGAGEVWRVTAVPGDVVRLPGSARRLLLPGGALAVSAGGPVEAPLDPGVYFVSDGAGDTVGALTVRPDPRESDLRMAPPAATRGSLGRARLFADEAAVVRAAFSGRRTELTTALLVAALLLAVAELALASAGGARARA